MSLEGSASFEVLDENQSASHSTLSTFMEDDELEVKLQRLKNVRNIDTLHPTSSDADKSHRSDEDFQLDYKHFVDFNCRFFKILLGNAYSSMRDFYSRTSRLNLICFVLSAVLVLLLSFALHGLKSHQTQLDKMTEDNAALKLKFTECQNTLKDLTERNPIELELPDSNDVEELKNQILEYQKERHELIKQVDHLRNLNGKVFHHSTNDGTFDSMKKHANRYMNKAKHAFKQLSPKQLNKKVCKEWGICLF